MTEDSTAMTLDIARRVLADPRSDAERLQWARDTIAAAEQSVEQALTPQERHKAEADRLAKDPRFATWAAGQ